MVFEQRVDGSLDFVVVRLTEKTIWQAIQKTGIPYEDWTAYKEPGDTILKLFIELKDGAKIEQEEMSKLIFQKVAESDKDTYTSSGAHNELEKMINFKVEVKLLPRGSFANYMAHRQAEGADLAHLKPPHMNPSSKVLEKLTGETEEIEVVKLKKAEKSTEIPV
jgi:hypothetical protein